MSDGWWGWSTTVRVLEFLGSEEKRGTLWNLVDTTPPLINLPQICSHNTSLAPTVLIANATLH